VEVFIVVPISECPRMIERAHYVAAVLQVLVATCAAGDDTTLQKSQHVLAET
jgi:hypothetical protein